MSEMVFANIAGFGARAVALVIDFALLAATQIFLFILLAGSLFSEVIHFAPLVILTLLSSFVVLFFVSFIFLHMFYFTLFHAWSGQTIGKMIMGIRVVTERTNSFPLLWPFCAGLATFYPSFPLPQVFSGRRLTKTSVPGMTGWRRPG